ncbi:MAG: acyl-CoA dehydrogenase [Planctomycetota bacterium]|jgi:acyl-CoA dehydrogenase
MIYLLYALLVLLGVGLVIVLVPPLRRVVIMGPIYRAIAPGLPRISATEQEALDAGTVWWDAELFTGNPDLGVLLGTDPYTYSSEEQAFLAPDGPCAGVCKLTDDWATHNELGNLAPEVWDALKASGTYGLVIDPHHGGKGFSARLFSDSMVTMASRSVPLAITAILPNSLGPGELLERYGTDAQKEYWLPRLASGEEEPAFGLTEPVAGSDAAGGMASRGVVERGPGGEPQLKVTWDKRYITMNARATVLGIAFKLSDPENLLGKGPKPGITLALVPRDTPGVIADRRHDPLGVTFINGTTQGTDVILPVDAIVGGAAQAGNGWRMLMDCLAAGRGIGLPALATGMAKRSARAASAYAVVRQQFRMPIGQFEGVQDPLARIAGYTWAMDSARMLTVASIDAGQKPSVITAMLKYRTTELARRVVNDAMDVMGGAGISKGPRNPIASAYLAAPIGITVEGANILTRSLIAFGQGVIRGHPHALKLKAAAEVSDPDERLRAFDRAMVPQILFSTRLGIRAFIQGLTFGAFNFPAGVQASPMEGYWRALQRWSAAFAQISDLSLAVLQGSLKFKEQLSGRMADALSGLYFLSAVLWRYEKEGRKPEDLTVVQWVAETCLNEISTSIDEYLRNFPNRLAAFGLRRLCFPWSPLGGWRVRPPSDALSSKLAAQFMTPGEWRDRLTAGCYLDPSDPLEPLTRLDDAHRLAAASAPILASIRTAQKDGRIDKSLRGAAAVTEAVGKGVISAQEAETLAAAEAARADVILVDDFGPEHFVRPVGGTATTGRPAKKAAKKATVKTAAEGAKKRATKKAAKKSSTSSTSGKKAKKKASKKTSAKQAKKKSSKNASTRAA